ncbi:hypothetical protein [Chitinimonas taiwanensis]|uniref:Uncharacterized protein n=1 Tax=Chitinimonas taiwanensis DSM 18899 TaxID=1121279 RepID=A0A1K2HLC2_9NEIS|nr:hypothetical protein [Chitinimonas taiwanensis]SFZ77612.1 hypothetical protein SAMN02745887_02521 [Chitinimonas taiwanensis DSM 18899]
MSKHLLCQDCLAISEPSSNENATCSCGGDLCGCLTCANDAEKLLSGERDYRRLHLEAPIDLSHWSASSGIRALQAA